MQHHASERDVGVVLKNSLHSWQVEWLREKIGDIPIRLVFESALELMGTTQLGGFKVGLHYSAGSLNPAPGTMRRSCQ